MRFLAINLNHPAHYLTFGPFSVSVGNLVIIFFMFLIFSLALILPFPDHDAAEAKKSAPTLKSDKIVGR
jgi:hypothetical protein